MNEYKHGPWSNDESPSEFDMTPPAAAASSSIPSSSSPLSVLRSPSTVLHLMESLAEHIIGELLEIHYAHEEWQEQKQKYEEEEKERRRDEILNGSPADDDEHKSSSSSSRSSQRARRTRRPTKLPRVHRICLQYQPATKNAIFIDGRLTFREEARMMHNDAAATSTLASSINSSNHVVRKSEPGPCNIKSEDRKSSAIVSSFTGLIRDSRWIASPSTSQRRGKRKRRNSGSSGSQASQASQDLEDEDLKLKQEQASESQQEEDVKPILRRSRSSSQDSQLEENDEQGGEDEDLALTSVQHHRLIYPSKRCEKRFAGMITAMVESYLAIQNRTSINKRALHYSDKSLYNKQSDSDAAIDLLCDLLQLPVHELNLIATSKGQIMGALWYQIANLDEEEEEEENFNAEGVKLEHDPSSTSFHAPGRRRCTSNVTTADCSHGAVITPFTHQIVGMTCDADWLLLVEKDTVWSKIAQSGLPQLERCIIVTDRGMPSKSTRHFLTLFHQYFPSIPLFGLFDPDPSGLDIYRVCKYGASRSVHEDLALPTLQLLGVRISDIAELGLMQHSSVAQPLTERDHTKLHRIINSEVGVNDAIIRAEAQCMLEHNRKAEIESLEKVAQDYLTNVYITRKVQQWIDAQKPEADSALEAAPPPPSAHMAADALLPMDIDQDNEVKTNRIQVKREAVSASSSFAAAEGAWF